MPGRPPAGNRSERVPHGGLRERHDQVLAAPGEMRGAGCHVRQERTVIRRSDQHAGVGSVTNADAVEREREAEAALVAWAYERNGLVRDHPPDQTGAADQSFLRGLVILRETAVPPRVEERDSNPGFASGEGRENPQNEGRRDPPIDFGFVSHECFEGRGRACPTPTTITPLSAWISSR